MTESAAVVAEGTVFSANDIVRLHMEFQFNHYLCKPRAIEITASLGCTEEDVVAWFRARRRAYRINNYLEPSGASESDDADGPQTEREGEPNIGDLDEDYEKWTFLEDEFAFNQHLCQRRARELSQALLIPEVDLQRWFRWRRLQYRKARKTQDSISTTP